MGTSFDLLADLADAEFDGESYNGKPLIETLSELDASAAAVSSTYEGYSAWSVALHVAYCKWVVAKALLDEDGKGRLGFYPYPVGDGGFAEAPEKSPEAWNGLLAYLRSVHGEAIGAMREFGEKRFDHELPEWGIPAGKAAIWLCSHDSYHTAQIRNMGLAAFKSKRVY
jgi:hypothetical protein